MTHQRTFLALASASQVAHPCVDFPAKFTSTPSIENEPNLIWWASFGDPVLSQLAVAKMGHGKLQEFTGEYKEITTLRLAAKAAYQMASAMPAERAK